jgi:hypothetical protein
MDVNEDLIQLAAPPSDHQVRIATFLPDSAPQMRSVPYDHDADLKRNKMSIGVGSTPKTTSSERNRKARSDRLFGICMLVT